MINYSGITARESRSVDVLPVGAYVGKVVDATLEDVQTSTGTFQRLVLKLDVDEGEYKGHFANLYEAQAGGMYPAKWKGVIRFNIPQAGSPYENGQKKALEHVAWCLQESNKGYTWDGDETRMKGLKVGFSVRERDWLMDRDGRISYGTTTEIGRLESVKAVHDKTVKPMKKRELRDAEKSKLEQYLASMNDPADSQTGFSVIDEEVPF